MNDVLGQESASHASLHMDSDPSAPTGLGDLVAMQEALTPPSAGTAAAGCGVQVVLPNPRSRALVRLVEPLRQVSSQGAAEAGGDGGRDSDSDGSGHCVEFRADSAFKFSSLKLCPIENFDPGHGLEHYIGLPTATNLVRAMMLEHRKDELFVRETGETRDVMLERFDGQNLVSPQSEWNLVIQGEDQYHIADIKLPKPSNFVLHIKGRCISDSTLQEQFDTARRNYPDLLLAEFIALRLWTGPMHKRYAFFFRTICACDQRDAACGPSPQLHCPLIPARYVTTMLALNSGVVKICRQQAKTSELGPRALHRGYSLYTPASARVALSWQAPPRTDPAPHHPDPGSGVEPCVLAFSDRRQIAANYAARGILLDLAVGDAGTRGANIGWLSQFPDEGEVLFPALCRVRLVGVPEEDEEAGVWACRVRVEEPAVSRTLEELHLA